MSERRDWYSVAELLELNSPALPATERGINDLALRAGWRDDPARARLRFGQGGGYEYHVSLLPAEVQARLAALAMPAITA